METNVRHIGPEDAIDRFARELRAHPEREVALKAALRQMFGTVPDARMSRRNAAPIDDDVEDLWDNVPV